MKVVKITHPDSTYPDAIEAVLIKLSDDYRLHSTCYLPSQIHGTGELMLVFEERVKFNVVPMKRKDTP